MFGQQSPAAVRRFQARASGSGFIVERNGDSALIVTNAHVVKPPGAGQVSKIEVLFQNGDRIPGHVYSANVGADLALVKIDNYGKVPPPVEIANSDKLQPGQWAIAIGEPFELKQTVTVGVVSGFNRDETIGSESGGAMEFKGLLQTSAPINPGNSGGPLVDVEGRLIGVNQSTASPQAGAQGIGFAIPSNTVRSQVALLEKNPGTHQGTNVGYIGAALVTVTPGRGQPIELQRQGRRRRAGRQRLGRRFGRPPARRRDPARQRPRREQRRRTPQDHPTDQTRRQPEPPGLERRREAAGLHQGSGASGRHRRSAQQQQQQQEEQQP